MVRIKWLMIVPQSVSDVLTTFFFVMFGLLLNEWIWQHGVDLFYTTKKQSTVDDDTICVAVIL